MIFMIKKDEFHMVGELDMVLSWHGRYNGEGTDNDALMTMVGLMRNTTHQLDV